MRWPVAIEQCRKSPRTYTLVAVILLTLALGVGGLAPVGAAPEGGRIPGSYIVVIQTGADPAGVARSHGLSPRFVYRASLNGFASTVPTGRLAALQTDPLVQEVIPDRVVQIPPTPQDYALAQGTSARPAAKPGAGGGGGSAGQVLPEGVKRIGADKVWGTHNGAGVGVAIVDTGIDFAHTDLPVANGSANCYTAFSSCQDDHGHGTHVAGTVAAKDNTLDVIGVAPGATLYGVQVLDQNGSGSDATIIAGLEWILSNRTSVEPDIRVANLSLGRAGELNDNQALRSAFANLHAAGVAVIVAAGNDATMEVSQQVPAGYPEVLAIASTTAKGGSNQCRFLASPIAQDTASYFTTDGKFNTETGIGVTISAPGAALENVSKGCIIKSEGILSTKLGGGTTRMSGTSMAAPHVAGVAALMWQKSPGISPETIRSKLRTGGGADQQGTAPKDSPTSTYSFDGEREGVVSAPGALAP